MYIISTEYINFKCFWLLPCFTSMVMYSLAQSFFIRFLERVIQLSTQTQIHAPTPHTQVVVSYKTGTWKGRTPHSWHRSLKTVGELSETAQIPLESNDISRHGRCGGHILLITRTLSSFPLPHLRPCYQKPIANKQLHSLENKHKC